MRSRRFSFLLVWAAVALLAVAGIAAVDNPGPTPESVRAEAAAASMGHTSGAYAGVAFAYLTGGQPSADLGPTDDRELIPPATDELGTVNTSTEEEEPKQAPGTIISPDVGWLSQVEVRALVSLFFEPEDVNQAIRVAWCESRFNPRSINNRTGGAGLFHHLPRYWEERASNAGYPGADQFDAEASVAAAAWEVYNGGGWEVFACRG